MNNEERPGCAPFFHKQFLSLERGENSAFFFFCKKSQQKLNLQAPQSLYLLLRIGKNSIRCLLSLKTKDAELDRGKGEKQDEEKKEKKRARARGFFPFLDLSLASLKRLAEKERPLSGSPRRLYRLSLFSLLLSFSLWPTPDLFHTSPRSIFPLWP